MSWIIAGMAGLGALQGAANQKKMERQGKYRAEVIKYSPWTGMSDPGVQELPDGLTMGLKGAAQGAMVSNMMGGGSAGAMGTGPGTMTSDNMGQQGLYNPYTMMQA